MVATGHFLASRLANYDNSERPSLGKIGKHLIKKFFYPQKKHFFTSQNTNNIDIDININVNININININNNNNDNEI